MAAIIKETVHQNIGSTPVVSTTVQAEATQIETVSYLIYFFFGVLEVLLAFRLVLKILGASLASGFVGFIYGITGLFILPFEGIFRRGVAQGIETTSVLEPSVIVALIVYAILAWGIVKLIQVLAGQPQE